MGDPLRFLDDELASLARAGLLRELHAVEGPQGAECVIDGRPVLNFSSNDYLGLAAHPALIAAARAALDDAGLGAGASRLITGEMTAHRRLESDLAGLLGVDAALLFNSGYHANAGTIPALVGRGDVVLSDALNHASIIDGCRLSRAEVLVYRHGEVRDLEEKLAGCAGYRRRLVVTDALFSMDGDLAPLGAIAALAEAHDAMVLVDEAHTTGVFGAHGQGLVGHLGLSESIPLRMGTLGKALGAFGAFVAGREALRTHLFNRARSFVFTTALPPVVCAAASAAVGLVREDVEGRRARLWSNVRHLAEGLSTLGLLDRAEPTPIFPLVIGDPAAAMRASEALKARGIYAHGIRPPTVPPGTSRIRLTVTAAHTTKHLDAALEALEAVLGRRPRAAML